jgi:propionyl-CoA synthetase
MHYVESYLPCYQGYYNTGNPAYVDSNGYVFIIGRTNNVTNDAGHRLSTGAMKDSYRTPKIADCAAIGVKDKVKGQVPVGFVTLITGSDKYHHESCAELVQRIHWVQSLLSRKW